MANIKKSLLVYSVGVDVFNSMPCFGQGTKKHDTKEIKKCIFSHYPDDFEDIEKDIDENFCFGFTMAKDIMLKEFKKIVEKFKEEEKE